MEVARRSFRNQILEDLRVVRSSIKHNEDKINRLTYEKQPFKTADLISKAKESLSSLKKQEEILVEKISKIEEGLYDEDIKGEIKTNTQTAKEKASKRELKKPKSMIKPAERKSNKEMKIERYRNYLENKSFPSERDMAIEYEKFLKSCARFPDGLREKLKRMPSNHGIMFNGIWFMGLLPEKKPLSTTMIEEKNGDTFYVHYYTGTQHLIYRKEGRGRQTKEILEKKEARARINFNLE